MLHQLVTPTFIILIVFITGLLQNAGTHIDPTKLIKVGVASHLFSYITSTSQEIPDQLKIAGLGLSLRKLLNDYQLQVNLREGCRKILVKDRLVSN